MSLSIESSTPLSAVEASIQYFIDCPTGTVEHYFGSPAFNWSDELYRIHGYERGDVVPTLDLGLSHIEPEDRAAARALWESLSTAGGPLSAYLSLRDVAGQVRKVLISGDLIREDETAIGVWCLVVDLTRSIHVDTHRLANQAVAASALNRAVIEQAKGILMGRVGLNATEAFERISQRSQMTNRKVVVVSQEIIDRAHQINQGSQHQSRVQSLLELFPTP